MSKSNDPYIHLTEAAIEAFHQRIENRNTPDARVRLGVKGSGGCKGMSYVIIFEDNHPREKDISLYYNGISVVVDNKSIAYLEGCILDYEQTLMSQGFVFRNNREKSRCGCGKSFSI